MKQQYLKENPETIKSLFDGIASRYDLANSILSFRIHSLWNKKLAKYLLREKPQRMLDLCSGTGEIALRAMKDALKQKIALPELYLVDFSKKMLEIAKMQTEAFHPEIQEKFHFFEEDAMNLPFKEAFFDAISCAYGIRNIQNPQQALQEIYRTLKPGGECVILELTRPKNGLLNGLHRLYISTLLPILGKWLTKDKEAYDYLQRSIQTFICPEELANLSKEVGFVRAEMKPLLGGIATLLFLRKP